MPIGAKPQLFTIEDKLNNTLRILAEMRNQLDADFLRTFIIDLSKKYLENNNTESSIDKDNISMILKSLE